MPKDYSEDQLIQRSAAELLEKELGWTSVYAFDKEVSGDKQGLRIIMTVFPAFNFKSASSQNLLPKLMSGE